MASHSQARHRAKLSVLLLSVLLVSGPLHGGRALAADASGEFKVFGSGSLTCARWVTDRQDGSPSAKQSEMWVAGYLTAYNQFVYKQADVTRPYDGEDIVEWLDGYCRVEPSRTLIMAAKELLEMLRRRN